MIIVTLLVPILFQVILPAVRQTRRHRVLSDQLQKIEERLRTRLLPSLQIWLDRPIQ